MPSSKPKGRTIEWEVRIHAPREAVWAALTEPTQLARWFPPVASGRPGLGEELTFAWGPALQWHTRVVAWEPGRHLVWRDEAVPQPDSPGESGPSGAGSTAPPAEPMAVDWTLEASGGQVLVRLVQSGFGEGDSWDDFFDGTDFGWRFYLHALRHYLERHPGKTRDMVWVRRAARGGKTAIWGKVWSAEGLAPSPDASRFATGRALQLQLGAERLSGTVDFVSAPRGLFATLGSHEEATLLVEMEPGQDALHAGIWLSTYGLPAGRVQALQTALTAMADRLFPGAGEQA